MVTIRFIFIGYWQTGQAGQVFKHSTADLSAGSSDNGVAADEGSSLIFAPCLSDLFPSQVLSLNNQMHNTQISFVDS